VEALVVTVRERRLFPHARTVGRTIRVFVDCHQRVAIIVGNKVILAEIVNFRHLNQPFVTIAFKRGT